MIIGKLHLIHPQSPPLTALFFFPQKIYKTHTLAYDKYKWISMIKIHMTQQYGIVPEWPTARGTSGAKCAHSCLNTR